jgi:hypothetical protein
MRIVDELESGSYYWIMENAEAIWRPCYISEDSDGELWIQVLGINFHVPLHQVEMKYFTFVKMYQPWIPGLKAPQREP